MMEAKEFLHKASGNIYSVIETYYNEFIKNVEDEEAAVSHFIELILFDDEIDETLHIETIRDESEYEIVLEEIEDIVNAFVDNLIKQDLSEENFYKKLFSTIKDDTFFMSDLSKICALIHLSRSNKMPYYYLSKGLKMGNDEFVEISKSLITELQKVRFVLNAGFSQKTEVSSKLLTIVEEISNPREKAVLLANIIGMFEHKIVSLEKQVKQLTTESNE